MCFLAFTATWAHYRWTGDSLSNLMGYAFSVFIVPGLFGCLGVYAAIFVGKRNFMAGMRMPWFICLLIFVAAYVPLILFLWGSLTVS